MIFFGSPLNFRPVPPLIACFNHYVPPSLSAMTSAWKTSRKNWQLASCIMHHFTAIILYYKAPTSFTCLSWECPFDKFFFSRSSLVFSIFICLFISFIHLLLLLCYIAWYIPKHYFGPYRADLQHAKLPIPFVFWLFFSNFFHVWTSKQLKLIFEP